MGWRHSLDKNKNQRQRRLLTLPSFSWLAVEVNGDGTCETYRYLKNVTNVAKIDWNFAKSVWAGGEGEGGRGGGGGGGSLLMIAMPRFLIDREGNVKHYPSSFYPTVCSLFMLECGKGGGVFSILTCNLRCRIWRTRSRRCWASRGAASGLESVRARRWWSEHRNDAAPGNG